MMNISILIKFGKDHNPANGELGLSSEIPKRKSETKESQSPDLPTVLTTGRSR